jgi:hypothetical protein
MRERGKYQIQCMKSRSSTGVGMKIDLEYDVETMRISDPGIDGDQSYTPKPSANDIMSTLKPIATVDASTGEITLEPVTRTVHADVQGSKLKAILNTLKK